MATKQDYIEQLQRLLPPGAAWTRDPDAVLTMVLGWIASELKLVDDRALDVLEEADPRTTLELLPDWEKETGLPDVCTSINTTLQERRQAVLQRLTMRGGQSVAFFQGIAEQLGYTVNIAEYKPFICGISRCGDALNGGASVRYYWTVEVTGPRLTYFRCGESRCGENLLTVQRAEDLECLFQRLAPAHTSLIFSYTGV